MLLLINPSFNNNSDLLYKKVNFFYHLYRMVSKSNKALVPVFSVSSHTKNSFDNLRKKIKTHYVSFIIDFFNSLIYEKYNRQAYKLRKPASDFIPNVNSNHITELSTTELKTVLSYDISNKYTRTEFNNNEKIINLLMKQKPEIQPLLEMTFEKFYKDYYLNKSKLIDEFGVLQTVVPFEDFYTENTINESKQYKQRLYDVANHFFEFRRKNNQDNSFNSD